MGEVEQWGALWPGRLTLGITAWIRLIRVRQSQQKGRGMGNRCSDRSWRKNQAGGRLDSRLARALLTSLASISSPPAPALGPVCSCWCPSCLCPSQVRCSRPPGLQLWPWRAGSPPHLCLRPRLGLGGPWQQGEDQHVLQTAPWLWPLPLLWVPGLA